MSHPALLNAMMRALPDVGYHPDQPNGLRDDALEVLRRLQKEGYVLVPSELEPRAGYEWDCPNCGVRVQSWVRPPVLGDTP